jgi:DNA-binding GntR family transcriptional regulator
LQAESGIVRKTLTEQVYETLKEQILDRDLLPGARLTIDTLTHTLNVSSSPVREALVRLEAERLVVLELYRGYTVAPAPSSDYLHALIDYRILTEGHCAAIGAPRRDPAGLKQMRHALELMSGTSEIGTHYRQYRRFVAADAQFHALIVASAGNPVIVDTYQSLHPILLQSRLYRERGDGRARIAQVSREHATILHAFEAGDGEAAREAIRVHFEGGRRRLMQAAAAPTGT